MSPLDRLVANPEVLSGQNVLITGAAGRIGSAVAKAALSSGANVLLADISCESLQRLCSDLSSFDSDNIFSFVADTSDVEQINSLITNISTSMVTSMVLSTVLILDRKAGVQNLRRSRQTTFLRILKCSLEVQFCFHRGC